MIEIESLMDDMSSNINELEEYFMNILSMTEISIRKHKGARFD